MSEPGSAEMLEIAPRLLLGDAETFPPRSGAGAAAPAGEMASRTCPGMRLQLHTSLGGLAAEWRAFEATADCTAFQRYDWASKWQRHIGTARGTRPAIVTGRDASGALVFIFQLSVERKGFARHLTFLGSDLCDYNGPILAPQAAGHFAGDRFPALWEEVLALIRAERTLGFDMVDLSRMPAKVGEQPNPFIGLDPTLGASSAHLATLGRDWEAFYASKRSSATRKRERRQFRHLAEFGEVRFAEPTDASDVKRTLAALFAQKAESFRRLGVENFLARPGHADFFIALATDPVTAPYAHVSRLDVGETPAGTGFGLEFRGRYYLLLSSYEDGPLARFGPGRAHLQELMRRAIDKGLAQFDFTVGDEAYKRDWADITLPLYEYFAASTLQGLPVLLATFAYRRAKRTIKQNPALWEAFSNWRSRWAAFRRGSPQGDETPPSEPETA